jgi:photosystem II stability/assembly factor-like uncharacterized protein
MLSKSKRCVLSVGAFLLAVGLFASCTGEGSPNIKVQFVNSKVGWIVGPRLLGTSDGGATWSEIRNTGFGTVEAEYIGVGHRSIHFIDSSTAVQLTDNGIVKTNDGARSWGEKLAIPKPARQDIPPQSLFFLSPDIGWVVGENVYKTKDGGRSWLTLCPTPVGDQQRQRNLRIAPTYANYMPALWFFDDSSGLMAKLDGELYVTADGGNTWERTLTVDKLINDVFFLDSNHGWLVGNEGFMAYTKDRGKTWTYLPPVTKSDLTSIFFVNSSVGCAVGYSASIVCTRDGGNTWINGAIKGLTTPSPLASVSFSDELHGWAVGGNADPMQPSLTSPSNVILTTRDGGRTWERVTL